jgi:hypothetical protein
VGARLLNRRPDLRVLVDRKVVEHDDVTRSQCRHQHLFDVGEKTRTIDRPIEHGWRADTLEAERGDHRVRLPVTAGRVIRDARPAKTAGVAAQQIRGHPGFIDEDVLARVVERQRLAPPTPRRGDIRATLFVGVYGLF